MVFTAQIPQELFIMNHKTPLAINIKNTLVRYKKAIQLVKFLPMLKVIIIM
jgi:hypothetical protein